MRYGHTSETPQNDLWRKRAILVTCCLSLFLVTMDMTVVNIALPAIRRDLHASIAGLQWSLDGYTVVVASFLMLSGALADRYGRRKVFQLGLAVFSLGSLLCSLAPTTTALVCARVLQALGGSMLNPVAMSIVVSTFTEARARARALGIWGATFGLSMAAGPVLGGLLVDSIGWRAIFWVNLPVGALALALSARFIPESQADRPRRLDLVAQALIVVALLALTSTVIEGRRVGWSSWMITAGFGAALVSVVTLVVWEARHLQPLLDLRLFRSVPFSSASALAMLAFAAFGAFLFLNSLYLQDARGLHASAAGLLTLPVALALVVCSPLSGRLVGAGHARLVVVVAGMAISAGGLLLTGLADDTPVPVLIVAFGRRSRQHRRARQYCGRVWHATVASGAGIRIRVDQPAGRRLAGGRARRVAGGQWHRGGAACKLGRIHPRRVLGHRRAGRCYRHPGHRLDGRSCASERPARGVGGVSSQMIERACEVRA
jgi:EmrB/QacA subfamily drug resistance transporter